MSVRNGGQLVVESLAALDVRMVFGVPGVHALSLWEGLRRLGMKAVVTRTELAAGFAADGYARSSGQTGVLFLSTGPGALNSLTAIMEAARAHVPVLAVTSQVPRAVLGRGRGYLHELSDQLACFAPLTKVALRAETAESVPGTLAAAWQAARTPPAGPVVVEIPVDVLMAETRVAALDAGAAEPPPPPRPTARAVGEVVELLAHAERPVIWAGGGTLRAGAGGELRQLAERLDAPVALTYMGKGALGSDHPLCLGSTCDDRAYQEVIEEADVLLCLGTELGAETTGQWSLKPTGRLVQVDAAPARMGATYPAVPVVADVREFLRAVLAVSETALPSRPGGAGKQRVARVRARVRDGLERQGRQAELSILRAIDDALGSTGIGAFDMTIAGYWAAAHLPVRQPDQFLYPLGSGTLGYALPAALGAHMAHPDRRVLAVVGDGGIHYALGELATMGQTGARVTLLIVDDGAYGILREYQQESFGATFATSLRQPAWRDLATAFGLPVRVSTPADLAEDLRAEGPNVVVLPAQLVSAGPTP